MSPASAIYICDLDTRRSVVGDGSPHCRPRNQLCRAPWPGLFALRDDRPRDSDRAPPICAADGPRQDIAFAHRQYHAINSAGCRLPISSIGALGPSRVSAAPYLITDVDPQTRAFYVRNPSNGDFRDQVAFLDMSGQQTSWTGDRREFLGRNGGLNAPAALLRADPLSGRCGSGFDPCGVQQTEIVLAPGEEKEIVLSIGWGARPRRSAGAGQEISRSRHQRRICGGEEISGTRRWAPSRSRHPIRRWTCWSIAGCCIRPCHAASGAAPDSIRRRALTASATSCRTAWRCAPFAARAGARASAARRRAAVPRRRCPALVAAGKRQGHPHANFGRQGMAGLRRCALCRIHGRPGRAGRRDRLPAAARSCGKASMTRSSSLRHRKSAQLFMSIARARWMRPSPSDSTACP